MSHIRYIQTRQNLQDACSALSVVYWTDAPFQADRAREALLSALCGAVHGPHDGMVEMLVQEANLTAPQAEAVMNALLDYAIPLPETKA